MDRDWLENGSKMNRKRLVSVGEDSEPMNGGINATMLRI